MEMPQMPKNSMFIISGNNTGTGILQNIIDSDGTGIIFETEADTITTAIGGDYGHWSDTLRNAFDHAGLSFNRRTDNEYRECDSTFLSMVLSGTPGQVAPLIPSGENGLFSREVFYYKSQIREWIDQFSVDEVDARRNSTGWATSGRPRSISSSAGVPLPCASTSGNKPLSTTASYVSSSVPGNPTGRR